jgi:hypothetical protein
LWELQLSSITSSFLVAMAIHPEVQNRGQKEIDAALHGSRLPTFQDHDLLPYIDCIVKELF